MTPTERVRRIIDEAVGRDLSSWERNEFLQSIRQRDTLTEKQERVLTGIEKRVLDGGCDE